MAAQAVGAGTVAAAIVGFGSAATTAGGSEHAAAAGGAVGGAKVTAGQVASELARTGVDSTTMFLVLSAILIIAGLLLVGLTRRHHTGARHLT